MSAKKKRISRKVIDSSQKWLQDKGLCLETLTEPQQQAIFHFIKNKRAFIGILWVSVPMILVYILLVVWFNGIVQDQDELVIPKTYSMINEAGETVYQDIPESLNEAIRIYGRLCLLFGCILGGLLYVLGSNIVTPIILYLSNKRHNKTITAFLPGNRN